MIYLKNTAFREKRSEAFHTLWDSSPGWLDKLQLPDEGVPSDSQFLCKITGTWTPQMWKEFHKESHKTQILARIYSTVAG
jgi:hypothetical protein